MKKLIIKAILASYILFGITIFIPYQYCMGGQGYGLPAAIVMPSHREKDWYFIQLESNKTHAAQISILSIIINLIIWPFASVIVLFFLLLLNKVRTTIVYVFCEKIPN